MSKHRVLLDEKLGHHAQPLLNDVGIKTDVVRLKTANLIKLLQAKPYNALIVLAAKENRPTYAQII